MLNKIEMEESNQFEDFVTDLLLEQGIVITNYKSYEYQCKVGENRTGIEIKYDKKMADTGNIYLEVAERHDPEGQFVPSGILRNDNSLFYVIGDRHRTYMFIKKYLKAIYKRFKRVQTETSIGYLMPVRYVEENELLTLMKWKDGRRYEKENEQTSEIGTR